MKKEETGINAKEINTSIGYILKAAREKQGYSLRDVEEETKIRRHYIQLLEDDDFAQLPGPVYAKGFLRSYARFLDIPGDPLIRMYNALTTAEEESEATITEKASERTALNTTFLKGIKIVAIAIMLIAGISFLFSIKPLKETGDGGEIGSNHVQENEESEDPDLELDGEAEGESDQGDDVKFHLLSDSAKMGEYSLAQGEITLKVRAENADCWIRVVSDEQIVGEEILRPGDIRVFTARERLLLKTGNPGALFITLNNEDLGIVGKNGVPKDFIFRLQ